MSRSCLAEEETILPYVDELLRKQTPYEVGLLIGKLAVGSRDLLYAVVKTPDADGEGAVAVKVAAPAAAKKKGAKTTSAGPDFIIPIDAEWIEEHARQVARMLPGGVGVVGLYAFCSEGSFKSSLPALQKATTALPVAAQSGEALVLHADSTSRNKFAAKRFDTKPGSTARSAELKFGKVLSQVHCAQALYPVDVTVAVPATGSATLADAAREALRAEAARVAVAEVSFGAALPHGAEQVCKVLGTSGAIGDGAPSPAALAIFRPPPCVQAGPTTSAASASASVRITGCVAARAYAYAREPWSRLVENIKEDIVASLTGRLELLVEDAERAEEEAAEEAAAGAGARPRSAVLSPAAQGQAVVAMPRRIAVPWLQGLEICDYLQQGESAADAVERMRELVGSVAAEAAPRELEQPADTAGASQPGGRGKGSGAGSKGSAGGGAAAAAAAAPAAAGAAAGAGNFVAAAGVAAVAALLGLLVVFDDQLLDII